MSSSSFPLRQPHRGANQNYTTTSGDTTASFDNLRHFVAAAHDDTDEDDSSGSNAWVSKFLAQRGNELYCRVPDDYLRDRFNLTNLHEQVPHFAEAWRLMVGERETTARGAQRSAGLPKELLQNAAQQLYGLLHARYCLSADGCLAILQRFRRKEYGCCPRTLCGGAEAPLLPVGMSDEPRVDTVKMYCARCNEVYEPRLTRFAHLDGAYFGTGLPHMLFMSHPTVRPARSERHYVGSLFGFRLAETRRPEAGTTANSMTTATAAAATDQVPTTHKTGK